MYDVGSADAYRKLFRERLEKTSLYFLLERRNNMYKPRVKGLGWNTPNWNNKKKEMNKDRNNKEESKDVNKNDKNSFK